MKKDKAQKLTPERVMEALATNNQKVTHEQALTIVKLIETLAKVTVDQFLRNQ